MPDSNGEKPSPVSNHVLYDLLTGVDRKVDRIDQRVTEVVLARLEQLERRVENHERKFERVNVKVYGFMAGAMITVAALTKAAGAW